VGKWTRRGMVAVSVLALGGGGLALTQSANADCIPPTNLTQPPCDPHHSGPATGGDPSDFSSLQPVPPPAPPPPNNPNCVPPTNLTQAPCDAHHSGPATGVTNTDIPLPPATD
jgi:hypothetical protein